MTAYLDEEYMRAALAEAQAAESIAEVPIGCVIVHHAADGDRIIARAGNRTRQLNDPTAHAEILAIREACATLGAQRIPDCSLYVTLEPCGMCAAAISFARIKQLVFGASDIKGGAVISGPQFYMQATCHHRPLVKGPVGPGICGEMLSDFFKRKRQE